MRPLPERRLETPERKRVRRGTTTHVKNNTYSPPARLIDMEVEARIGVEEIEVWYAETLVQRLPRLRGQDKHWIDYRHIIGWLVRKPGAFAHYVYRADVYPTLTYRRAYDALLMQQLGPADREYVHLLCLPTPFRRAPAVQPPHVVEICRPAAAAPLHERPHLVHRRLIGVTGQDLRGQPRAAAVLFQLQHLGPDHAGGLQLAGAHVMAEGRLAHAVQIVAEPLVDFRLPVHEPFAGLAVDLGGAGLEDQDGVAAASVRKPTVAPCTAVHDCATCRKW